MFFKNFHHNSRLKTVDYAIPTERGKKECLQYRRHKAFFLQVHCLSKDFVQFIV